MPGQDAKRAAEEAGERRLSRRSPLQGAGGQVSSCQWPG